MQTLNTLKQSSTGDGFPSFILAREVFAGLWGFYIGDNMKTCEDGRIWGQNNKEAGDHLGIRTSKPYIKKPYNMRVCSIKGCNRKHYGKGLCKKHYCKQYNQKHKEHIASQKQIYSKQYRAKNRKSILEYQKQHYQANKERIKQRHNEYGLQHKEEANKRSAIHYEKNREDVLIRTKKWRRNHREISRIISKNQHAKRNSSLKNAGKFTHEEWISKLSSFNNRCACCSSLNNITVDHIIPITKNGKNTIDNIQPLCMNCNTIKHSRIITNKELLKLITKRGAL